MFDHHFDWFSNMRFRLKLQISIEKKKSTIDWKSQSQLFFSISDALGNQAALHAMLEELRKQRGDQSFGRTRRQMLDECPGHFFAVTDPHYTTHSRMATKVKCCSFTKLVEMGPDSLCKWNHPSLGQGWCVYTSPVYTSPPNTGPIGLSLRS